MLTQLMHNWWLVVLRGLLAILFGVIAFTWPGIAIFTLVLFFGAYALIGGIFALIAAINHPGHQRWWLLFEGIVSVIAGILTFAWPGITAITLLYVIAVWAIWTGIFQIIAATELRKELTHEWLFILSGILSVVFGAIVIARPGVGALSIVWLIALYAVIFGILFIALGFRLRSLAHHFPVSGVGMA
jgi:uncharacterized membrane protein HdeD (DUF308 family)